MSEQSLHALRIANQARLGASALRAEIVAGVVSIADALEDPRAQCMTISRLLCAQPKWGPKKASALLNRNFIFPTRKVRDLTERQRHLIAGEAER